MSFATNLADSSSQRQLATIGRMRSLGPPGAMTSARQLVPSVRPEGLMQAGRYEISVSARTYVPAPADPGEFGPAAVYGEICARSAPRIRDQQRRPSGIGPANDR
jgi:hypothetical protein